MNKGPTHLNGGKHCEGDVGYPHFMRHGCRHTCRRQLPPPLLTSPHLGAWIFRRCLRVLLKRIPTSQHPNEWALSSNGAGGKMRVRRCLPPSRCCCQQLEQRARAGHRRNSNTDTAWLLATSKCTYADGDTGKALTPPHPMLSGVTVQLPETNRSRKLVPFLSHARQHHLVSSSLHHGRFC